MKPYELSDIYGKLKDAVKLWPIEQYKPNTFAVIESEADMDTANLGKTIKDKDRPYFYSKAWADKMFNPSQVCWSLPAILLIEVDGQINSDASYVMNHTIEMIVVDSPEMPPEKWVIPQGQKRTPHEIFQHTEKTMIQVLTFLRSLDLGIAWSKQYEALFHRFNPTLSYQRWQGGSGLLYGNFASFTIGVPCASDGVTLRANKDESYIQDYHKSQPMPVAPAALSDFDLDELGGLDGGGLSPLPPA